MAWRQPQGIGVKIPEQNKLIIIPSITIYDTDNVEIGFITDLTPDSTRNVERIRILYAGAAGRVVEQVPGVEDWTIRCTGFALYEQTLPGALTQGTGANKIFHSLNSQYIPFKITIEEVHPITGDTITTEFGDCWLTAYSHPISVRNLHVAETATIQPAWVHTIEPSTQLEIGE